MDETRGRPSLTKEDKDEILTEIIPYLRLGNSLNSAIQSAGLSSKKSQIYELAANDDYFMEKIEQAKAFLKKCVNGVFGKRVIAISAKFDTTGKLEYYDENFLKWFAINNKTLREEYGEHKELTGKGGKDLIPNQPTNESLDEVNKKVALMLSQFEEYDKTKNQPDAISSDTEQAPAVEN